MEKAVNFYEKKLGLKPYLRAVRYVMDTYQQSLSISYLTLYQDRMSAFALGPTTLLLFQLGMTTRDVVTPRGTIPHHAPTSRILDILQNEAETSEDSTTLQTEETKPQSLQQHYCLAVDKREDVEKWEEYLKAGQVTILSTMDWERGGKSVYFEDVDGHIGEIGSRGIWEHF
jgi:catechol 2,3-dioxygenase-like lactoylglutathione lyase family enzyme